MLAHQLPHHLTIAAIDGILAKVAERYTAERRAAEVTYGQAPSLPAFRAMRRARCAELRAHRRVRIARAS